MSAVGDAVHVLPVSHRTQTGAARQRASLGRCNQGRHPSFVVTQQSMRSSSSTVRRLARLSRRAPHACCAAVRCRARSAGVSQGRHRDCVHARARQARVRSCPCTRHELAFHDAPDSGAPDRPARAGSVLRVSRRAGGAAGEPGSGTWVPGPREREDQRRFYAQFDRPVAAIVVATSKPEKDWLPERWAEVARALDRDAGLTPVLVGGTSPREQAAAATSSRVSRHAPYPRLAWAFARLVGVLDGAALVLTPDTGPLHMAVALGRPVIGLYGYTNPKRTGPYRRFQDLVVDAYGDPGEDYPVSMELRPGRMVEFARITCWRRWLCGGSKIGRRRSRVCNRHVGRRMRRPLVS